MAANKRKILETARKLAQKGAKDKALKEYEKLLKLDPKDAKLRLEIGDAHRRWGQVEEAIETYTRVAKQYMAEGFDARAVAVYKQIVNLDPDCLDAYAPLAELYERMGLNAEAIAALQTAADGYHRLGRKSDALGLLRRMASADPTNTTSRIKVADLLRQEGMTEDAVAEYEQAAAELERQGDLETVGNVYRRILECDEKNVSALGSLARNLAARGKVTESIPLAERALSLQPGVPERYETLAELYSQANREGERADVYRKLADLYRERGDEDTARNILQRYVPSEVLAAPLAAAAQAVEPDAADELLATGGMLFDAEFEAGEVSEPELVFANEERLDVADVDPGEALDRDSREADALAAAELSLEEPGLDDAITLDQPIEPIEPIAPIETSAPPEASAPAEPAPAPPPPAGPEDVEQLLAEASVYLRYGKRDRALSHLERVLVSQPEHRTALEKLGEVFVEAGESERAVEVWLQAAKRALDEGDEPGLRALRERIAALDPTAAAHIVPGRAAHPEPEAPSEALEFAVGSAQEIDLDLGGLEDELDLDGGDEDLLDDVLDGDLSVPSLAGEAQDLEFLPPSPGEASASASASLSASASQQVQDDLEEADFYMEQGLLDEAEGIYKRVLALAPNHPRALLRLGEVASARGGDAAALPATDALDSQAAKSAATLDSQSEAEESAGALDSDTLPDELLVDDDISVPALPEAAEPALAARSEEALSIELPSEGSELETGADPSELSDLDLDVPPSAEGESGTGGEPDGSDTEEFEVAGVAATGEAVAEPPAEEAGDFDLAAALADAFEDDDQDVHDGRAGAAESDGFDAVFDAFKKGVSETLDAGDHQAHYDLAIAYKEMGLHDDAIAELEIVMADPGREAECLHLIALCALDADRAPMAVEHLERLLALPDLTPEAGLASRFELGRALLDVGDREGARNAWSEVARQRPGFQGVESRLAELETPEPEEGDGAEDFESFDDVLEAVFDEDEVGDADPADAAEEPDPAAHGAEPEPQSDPPRDRKRKKKISFV